MCYRHIIIEGHKWSSLSLNGFLHINFSNIDFWTLFNFVSTWMFIIQYNCCSSFNTSIVYYQLMADSIILVSGGHFLDFFRLWFLDFDFFWLQLLKSCSIFFFKDHSILLQFIQCIKCTSCHTYWYKDNWFNVLLVYLKTRI